MAERIVSPGVFTRENDLSFLSQGIGEIGAAFIGPFKQGPAFVPTLVRTQSEFEEIFGTPDGTYYTEYAVQNYLREAGVATIVRVGGVGGYTQAAPLAIVASTTDIEIEETFIVKSVANPDTEIGGNIYEIDGVNKPELELVRGGVYTFDVSDSSNTTHPLRFRVGGVGSDAFTDGVVITGTQGQAGATVVFTVPSDAPDNLQYYCTAHPGTMGNVITIAGEVISETKIVGVIHNTNRLYQEVGFTGTTISNDTLKDGNFLLTIPSGSVGNTVAIAVSASILPRDKNDISDVFGTSPYYQADTAGVAANGYTFAYFENVASQSETAVVSELILPTQNYTEDATYASTPFIKSQDISGNRFNLFRFHTLGDGTLYNTKFKVGISNVKAAGEDGSTDYSVFSVTIRRFDDTDRRKVVLESFNNVNLDPASPNYIARVIGDRHVDIDNLGKITEEGDYANKSKYIRVEVSEQGSFPISAAPFGHGAYLNPILTEVGDASKVPAVVYQTTSTVNDSSSPINFSGLDFETVGVRIDNIQYFKPLPNGVTVGANVDFAFDANGLTLELTGSKSEDMVKRQFILGFQEGFDGLNPVIRPALGDKINGGNTQGFDCSTAVSSGSVAYRKAIAAVSNPDEFDINMVVTPGIIRELHPAITTRVIDMVESRQDAFYIADFTSVNAVIATATEQANAVDSNYVATYYPWVKTIDNNTNRLLSVPPSTLLPAVFAANDRLAAEWFAPAGLNRGGITGAVNVLNRLTHSERDVLYENKVNPIATFPGQGIVAYGQKTLQDRASALDRINVRRLLITVKKFVASTSRFLVFEQNTSETRTRFLNTVNPYFEAIQQRQGLFAFNVVMDESNNTPDVIDRNILAGQIFLQPARTAEFIVIDFNILPTGAQFSA